MKLYSLSPAIHLPPGTARLLYFRTRTPPDYVRSERLLVRLLFFTLLLLLLLTAATAADSCAVQHCVRLPLLLNGGQALAPEPSPTTPTSPTATSTSPPPTSPATTNTPTAIGTDTPNTSPTPPASPTDSPTSTVTASPTSAVTMTPTPSPTATVLGSIEWVTGTLADQPYGNSEAQSVVIGNRLYSFGGFDITRPCCTPTPRSFVYDPIANSWSAIRDLPFSPSGKRSNGSRFGGVTHAGVASDGTYAYFAGGYTSNQNGSGQIFNSVEVWRYDPGGAGGGTYTRFPDLPEPRAAGVLTYIDRGAQGRALHYIAGTYRSRGTRLDVGDHWSLDMDALEDYLAAPTSQPAPAWRRRATLPNPRHHAAAVVHNGRIYYIGGEHEHDDSLTAQSDVHVYDPANDNWTLITSTPYPQTSNARARGRNHAAFTTLVFDNQLLLIGGQTYHRVAINRVDVYDFATGQWRRLPNLPRNIHSAVGGLLSGSDGKTFIMISTGLNRKESIRGMLHYQ